jgi:alkaline phosphatase D
MRLIALTGLVLMTGCVSAPTRPIPAALSGINLPQAPTMATLPASRTMIDRIAIGSCRDEDKAAPILSQIAARRPDLFLAIGDNVYASEATNDASLPDLRGAYQRLSEQSDFQTFASRVPILAIWDDHDFGRNDGGSDFGFKASAETIFEHYWGAAAGDARTREGNYHAHTYGPAGQRVQIIMLDTRSFRSPLTRSDQPDTPGKERYMPSTATRQSMLGDAQWSWLAAQLRQPADIRIVVSSIQVLSDAHGWEAWRLLPAEQVRLFATMRQSGAKGVVLVSGDRHLAALYRQDGLLSYPVFEVTGSSLNLSYRDENLEMASNQIGAAFARENFGEIAIDWQGRSLALRVIDNSGSIAREQVVAFSQIGL